MSPHSTVSISTDFTIVRFSKISNPPIVRENFTIVRFFESDLRQISTKKPFFVKDDILIMQSAVTNAQKINKICISIHT